MWDMAIVIVNIMLYYTCRQERMTNGLVTIMSIDTDRLIGKGNIMYYETVNVTPLLNGNVM